MNDGLLIDTSVISLLSPDRKEKLSDAVKAWFHEQGAADALYLSAMTIAEIEKGMRSLHCRGGIERAKRLNEWLDLLVDSFADRILTVDPIVARIAGALEDAATAEGRHPGLGDILIAATAKAYGLTVVTANLMHFLPLGVDCDLPAVFRREGMR
ncbi:plasmid stabilization protein [Rhizobium rhizosphaerae]|uniref:Ribonuclease VapC n=1 Tax=Xaviernesmea rhizosphaerae TaxID=1672749 RepID=A0A1Q9AQF1_9HYPH|nr:type II toxin-antitoxin system VapC family toxin [Xaviernesmea rhizosphaerae]OLP57609.1 plasmid stabilization protein [Xaviernesmea rhizosphaerae]OQP83955.1 VapC toxin family PIN domain ribonuclease [Xaviernesmea rhizosphaerae]